MALRRPQVRKAASAAFELDARAFSYEFNASGPFGVAYEQAPRVGSTSIGGAAAQEITRAAAQAARRWHSSRSALAPVLIGRTLLSSKPHEAAALYVRRFGAKIIERAEDAHFGGGLLSSTRSKCTTVVTVEMPAERDYQRIQFVRDECKITLLGTPNVAHTMEVAHRNIENSTDIDLALPWEPYAAWIDNHDGTRACTYRTSLVNVHVASARVSKGRHCARLFAPWVAGYMGWESMDLNDVVSDSGGTVCSGWNPIGWVRQQI